MISVKRAFHRWRLASKVRHAEARVDELEAFARALPAQTQAAYARLAAVRASYFEIDIGRSVYRPEACREPATRVPRALVLMWTDIARDRVKKRCAERRIAQAFAIVERGMRGELADVSTIGPPVPFQRPRIGIVKGDK